MKHKYKLILIIGVGLTSLTVLLAILLFTIFCCRKRKSENGCRDVDTDRESAFESEDEDEFVAFVNHEDFIKFGGGEDLSVEEILDAPGEVIGKCSYGTLYRASLVNSDSVALLRFLRPSCTLRIKDVMPIVEILGCLRHPNLVPLNAFYRGPRGEKLMVHPFFGSGNLAHFIKDGAGEVNRWHVIHKISVGIAEGVCHLHSAREKPIIHGNLKSKNVLLDRHQHPYVSDFGLYLLLNPTAGQQMLEDSASQGYKAPELIKMKDANKESDIYSLGIILLELLCGKSPSDQDLHLPTALSVAVLDGRVMDLYRPDILVGLSNDQRAVMEDRILQFFHLAMACCSPSPRLRPDIDQILEKLQEIGK
ncbi:Protein kinase superfamily protein [Perilla frutescens var. frutescens]|nr:Protein kinase superfamily protein [Perilla frutescens var. frutescens]